MNRAFFLDCAEEKKARIDRELEKVAKYFRACSAIRDALRELPQEERIPNLTAEVTEWVRDYREQMGELIKERESVPNDWEN